MAITRYTNYHQFASDAVNEEKQDIPLLIVVAGDTKVRACTLDRISPDAEVRLSDDQIPVYYGEFDFMTDTGFLTDDPEEFLTEVNKPKP